MSSDILNQLDDKNVCVVALTAGIHGILLDILEQTYGIPGTVLHLFKSYLTGRVPSVQIDTSKAKQTPLLFGVLHITFMLMTSNLYF